MLPRLAFVAFVAQTDALYWMSSTPTYDFYSLYTASAQDVEVPPSPRWTVSRDAYELKVRLPDLEPSSVRAALGKDGTKVEVIGERKIDGCSCTPSTVKEIALPYRPRAEDIDVALDKHGMLSMRLLRSAAPESATPLKVNVAEAHKAEQDVKEAETQKLRFVPHESAQMPKKSTVEEQEKSLTDKFRSAALAAVAVQRENVEPSAKEPTMVTAEAAANAQEGTQPADTSKAANA